MTTSLTSGSFLTSISSFRNGIRISTLDRTGGFKLCAEYVLLLAGLLSTISSSYVTGTSTVLVSIIGSLTNLASLQITSCLRHLIFLLLMKQGLIRIQILLPCP